MADLSLDDILAEIDSKRNSEDGSRNAPEFSVDDILGEALGDIPKRKSYSSSETSVDRKPRAKKLIMSEEKTEAQKKEEERARKAAELRAERERKIAEEKAERERKAAEQKAEKERKLLEQAEAKRRAEEEAMKKRQAELEEMNRKAEMERRRAEEEEAERKRLIEERNAGKPKKRQELRHLRQRNRKRHAVKLKESAVRKRNPKSVLPQRI